MAMQFKTGNLAAGRYGETANDRFKSTFGALFWGSVILATVLHFALIKFFPQLKAADIGIRLSELEAVELPPEIEIPPPPEPIRRPALPIVAKMELDEDVTIAPTTFEQNPVETLPPPPENVQNLGDQPVFTPYTVAPRLRDRGKAAWIVQSHYPPILQRAGIGGTVTVWAFIDAQGIVKNAVVRSSSGNVGLDNAALLAIKQFLFHPALNMDTKVPVWIAMPLVFRLE